MILLAADTHVGTDAFGVRAAAVEGPGERIGLPPRDAPCDDPRRRELGDRWEAYVETSVARFDSCGATGEPAAIFVAALRLMPEYSARYIAENYFWPDAIYDRALLAPARALLARTDRPALHGMALASMAASARAFDWAMACSLATQAYRIADSLTISTAVHDTLGAGMVHTLWNVIDFMESELHGELSAHRVHLSAAIEKLRGTSRGADAGDEVLADPVRLWRALSPFLPSAAAGAEGRSCRDPAGFDLTTNRLLTDPGLRFGHAKGNRWGPPGDAPRGAHRLRIARSRRGQTTILVASWLADSRLPHSPQTVMHNYVLAHGRRDADLLASTLHPEFRNHTSPHGSASRDAELASMRGLFDGMEWIDVDMRHGIPRPSTHPDHPADSGYWEMAVMSCRYRFLPLGAEEVQRARQEHLTFYLRPEGGHHGVAGESLGDADSGDDRRWDEPAGERTLRPEARRWSIVALEARQGAR